MDKAEEIKKEWLELMAKEELKLDEMHKKLIEQDKKFISICERIKK